MTKTIDTARAVVLLKAAHDLLKQADDSPVVIDVMETAVEYDGTDCDGKCLMEDIEHFLDQGN